MSLRYYQDILVPRRAETSNFLWASRTISPQLAWVQSGKTTPQLHKDEVLKSSKIQEFIRALSIKHGIPVETLEAQVTSILNEIGYDKNIKVIRWLGLTLVKICLRTLSGLYVNTHSIQELKLSLGHCPVIFVPSHRSYADFILMSYICFNEDLAIPAIAAGMDFHRMWGMGQVLRKTGAFFIRRSYNDDNLYWTTFKQYISQLVTKGDLPMEFFIEGTRSRSNKSLTPKYGLILMILKAYFLAQVPDIFFVPINISYDRILEEKLFAFEHLGVPKPKESTSGFFKSLSIVKEKYGSIYVDFDKPISVREFLGTANRSAHSLGPMHHQEVSEAERKLVPALSHEIVQRQQTHCVVTTFNLIAMVLNNHLISNKKSIPLNQLIDEMLWLKNILETLGARTDFVSVEANIRGALNVHNNVICLDSNNVFLVDFALTGNLAATKLQHETIRKSLPFIMLQIYVNPVLHYFIDACLVVLVLNFNNCSSQGQFYHLFVFLKTLFSQEFVSYVDNWQQDFDKAVLAAVDMNVLKRNEDFYELGENLKLVDFLYSIMDCFTYTYYITCGVLETVESTAEQKQLLSFVQCEIEKNINKEPFFVHPYCLSLEMITNCLYSLSNMQALNKNRGQNGVVYEINKNGLCAIKSQLECYLLHKDEMHMNADLHPYLRNKL